MKIKTGVFATDDEIRELQQMVAQIGPRVEINGPAGSITLASPTMEDVHQRLNEIAISHGLPKIVGDYGIDGREFTRFEKGQP